MTNERGLPNFPYPAWITKEVVCEYMLTEKEREATTIEIAHDGNAVVLTGDMAHPVLYKNASKDLLVIKHSPRDSGIILAPWREGLLMEVGGEVLLVLEG